MKKQLLALLLWSGMVYAQQPVDYVNPFIGTSNFGTTNPGAVCPQGMMSVTPFNVMGSETNTFDKDSRWWSTPYSSDNDFFTGFAHVNLSGVGCPELGSLLLMPTFLRPPFGSVDDEPDLRRGPASDLELRKNV